MIKEIRPYKGNRFEVDVKRFYIPVVVISVCPECTEEVRRNLEDNYLSYPTLGAPTKLYFSCSNEHEWQDQVIVNITVEAV